MVHNLKQYIKQIRVGFFNLIHQQDRMGVFADAVCQHSALVKSDVAGRCTDQTGDSVLFHILAHIKTHELHTQNAGHLQGNFGFADTGGTGKQKTPHRPFR